MKELTQKQKKQRIFLVALPLLTIPFVCVLFWSLGGGNTVAEDVPQPNSGLNTHLPDAQLNAKDNSDKMSFYHQAQQDSLKIKEQISADPYYQRNPLDSVMNTTSSVTPGGGYNTYTSSFDPNVDRINQKLSKLQQHLEAPDPEALSQNDYQQAVLQRMLQQANTAETADPEMQQLDGMLEKIMDIQNPQRAKDKLLQQSLKNRKRVYPVTAGKQQQAVQLLGNDRKTAAKGATGFYEWSEDKKEATPVKAITAVVQNTTTLVTGATIKLRITNEVYINGTAIPAGTFIYGTCTLNGDRLQVTITSIRYNAALFPVSLTVYDMDGIVGIYIPGAISRDVAKNSAQDAVQGVDYYALDNSVSAQAASVGVQAAKSLFSKKAKLIKVTVKAGYKVLLQDTQPQD